MDGAITIRALDDGDLPDYKLLRDSMLRAHPEAFTSNRTAASALQL